jgi:hypothetical protein
MKSIQPRPFADPEAAARKLLELANAATPAEHKAGAFVRFTQAGRTYFA